MSEETLYTIGDLADRAGVTPRTIRYYTAEGLLPRPDARGQYALYGEEHLLRLQLIARLKAAYLPLGEIKAQIQDLDLSQLRALLQEYPDLPEPSTSAADYVSHLLARQQTATLSSRQSLAGQAAASMPRMQAFSIQPPDEDSPAQPAATPPYGFAEPIALPPPAPALAPAAAQPSLLRKLIPQRHTRAEAEPLAEPAPAAEEHWRRVSIAPGVELHIREPLAPTLRERVERLLALARDLLTGT